VDPPAVRGKTSSKGQWRAVRISGTLYYIVRNTRPLTGIQILIARMLNSTRRNSGAKTAILILLLSATAILAAPQQKGARKQVKPAAPSSPAALAVPFRNGESLSYSGQWLSLKDVIGAQLTSNGDHPFNGHPAWHFRAQLQTKNPLRYVLQVDDHFDSYSSHSDLAGEQFELHLNESGKSENHVLRLTPAQGPLPAGTTQLQLVHGTRDALGFLYFLRTVNWQSTPEVRCSVFDGRKVYDVRANVVAPRSEITVGAGKFTATGLGIHPFINGKELADTKITLWIAQDAAHTPVLIDLALPFGSGRVELIQANAGK
jgi:hypothetical protein